MSGLPNAVDEQIEFSVMNLAGHREWLVDPTRALGQSSGVMFRARLNQDDEQRAEQLLAGLQQALVTHCSVGNDDLVGQMCQYALFPAGKLIRPLLLLEGCVMVGGLPQTILSAAAGAEYAHVASLIHDDIIDKDEIRRGRDALHCRYGTEHALLTGDFLVFQSFLALANCQKQPVPPERIVRAVQTVALVGMDMCRGQVMEAQVAGDLNCDLATYFQIIQLKTASLFRGTLESGAILGGGSIDQITALAEYGERLGILFQVVDDLLCYTKTEVLGKPQVSDLRNKRLTLPIILAYQNGNPAVRGRIKRMFNSETRDVHSRYADLLRSLEESGAIDKALSLAKEYAEAAEASLFVFPESASRQRLQSYIHLCFNRRK